MPTFNDILVLLPEFYLVAAACVLLLADAFMKPEQRWSLHWLSIVVMLLAGFMVIAGQPDVTVTAFGDMFIRDQTSEILKVFALLCTVLVFIYARPYLLDRKQYAGEFYTLMIFATIGVMLLVSAGNLVMIYLGLELLTLSSYALVALNRDSPLSSEAAIKYFVLGALSSGMLLYGMSMVYGATRGTGRHVAVRPNRLARRVLALLPCNCPWSEPPLKRYAVPALSSTISAVLPECPLER